MWMWSILERHRDQSEFVLSPIPSEFLFLSQPGQLVGMSHCWRMEAHLEEDNGEARRLQQKPTFNVEFNCLNYDESLYLSHVRLFLFFIVCCESCGDCADTWVVKKWEVNLINMLTNRRGRVAILMFKIVEWRLADPRSCMLVTM